MYKLKRFLKYLALTVTCSSIVLGGIVSVKYNCDVVTIEGVCEDNGENLENGNNWSVETRCENGFPFDGKYYSIIEFDRRDTKNHLGEKYLLMFSKDIKNSIPINRIRIY